MRDFSFTTSAPSTYHFVLAELKKRGYDTSIVENVQHDQVSRGITLVASKAIPGELGVCYYIKEGAFNRIDQLLIHLNSLDLSHKII